MKSFCGFSPRLQRKEKSIRTLTLFDDVDEVFSPLLEVLVPFSISQRLPSVGLPRAARAPCSKSRRKLKSGNEKDERLRRMVISCFESQKSRVSVSYAKSLFLLLLCFSLFSTQTISKLY
jgi:hypothetical protein